MKVMIFGSQGQLGTELVNLFSGQAIPYSRNDVDITNEEEIAIQLSSHDVSLVINAAAYNKVDQAEDEPEVAYGVNAVGPRNLALLCSQYDIPLVHISSDYVFGQSTSETPWRETDCPGPISAYGVSKLAGEHFVRSITPKHFVIRTCGLYGHAARASGRNGNFVETMLRLGDERSELNIVDDQYCTPTSVKDLAKAIMKLSATTEYGLYHATNAGVCTWARFAEQIFKFANMPTKVIRIPSTDYPTKARRPSYSLLNCQKINSIQGITLPDWRESLSVYLNER